MLHVAHAARSDHHTIVIKSPDTDVFILGLYTKISLPETSLFLYTGSGEYSRIIALDVISSSTPLGLISALPGLHAFTGNSPIAYLGDEDENKKLKKIKRAFRPRYTYDETDVIMNTYFSTELQEIKSLKRREQILRKKIGEVMEEKTKIMKRLEEASKSIKTLQTAMINIAESD